MSLHGRRVPLGASALAAVALLALTANACILEIEDSDDDRCGSHMRYVHDLHACVCDDRSIAVTGGCRPCADDEVVVEDACACPDGEAKSDAGVCTATAPLDAALADAPTDATLDATLASGAAP